MFVYYGIAASLAILFIIFSTFFDVQQNWNTSFPAHRAAQSAVSLDAMPNPTPSLVGVLRHHLPHLPFTTNTAMKEPFFMAMTPAQVEALIREALPDADVQVEDTVGDGEHLAATVVSERFRGVSRVAQHQMVYAALQGRMGQQLHALALRTTTPG